MDVNGLRLSDEFRMRSPVVWLCFGIVVLCALSAESGIQRSYHLIHGQTGPIYRSVIPTTGYTSFGPQILGRGLQRQDGDEGDGDDDEEEEDEEDEEYDEHGPEFGFQPGVGGSSPYPYPPHEEEDEDDEEEEEEDEDEEQVVVDDGGDAPGEDRREENIEGRQAYVNNQFVEQPYGQKQNNRLKQQYNNNNFNRVPANNNNRPQFNNNNNRAPAQGNRPNNRPNNNFNNAPNRRPNPRPNAARPGQLAGVQNNNRIPPGNRPQQVNYNPPRNQQANRQKLQLKPVASSTQFIATPVADLILRLSISLAKPLGQGNRGNFNVPIRIQQDDVKDVKDVKDIVASNVLNLGSKVDDDLPKTDKTPVAEDLLDKQHDEEVDGEGEEEEERVEKEEAPAVPVTELPRK